MHWLVDVRLEVSKFNSWEPVVQLLKPLKSGDGGVGAKKVLAN